MTSLGFIGCGKMAGAILRGVVKMPGFSSVKLYLSDKDPVFSRKLAAECGALAANSNLAVAESAETVVVCVKPSDVQTALVEMRPALGGKLIISIAAGIPIAKLMEYSGGMAGIVRVMPNTPALVHRGATAYALGQNVTSDQTQIVEKIFGAIGLVFPVAESALDAVTGLSGSGPAYVYTFIEAMVDGGVQMGLSRDLAQKLATQTVIGSGEMVLQTQMDPAALRDMVTSPGGTTIAGMEFLENSGFRAGIIAAIRAATERSVAIRESQ